jgi:hypothetical protein
MINYVLMYNDLVDSNNMFSLITWESFLFFVFICIFLLSLPALIFSLSKEEIKKQKLFYRKISFGITVFTTLTVLIAAIIFFNNKQKEKKNWETNYNISATKLIKNVKFLKSEINYLTIKDKDLYMNKLLNKFYGNDEKNLNAEEKELMRKLVR